MRGFVPNGCHASEEGEEEFCVCIDDEGVNVGEGESEALVLVLQFLPCVMLQAPGHHAGGLADYEGQHGRAWMRRAVCAVAWSC